ncbi:4Fe-4S domain-containing protein [Hoyosella subflava]|uniref:Conserved domain protein n=1 Tax=Hoyosella subflava (strain DSM 45089 / JCM 17490 / NBRC 109087 / DQS3-9A1) TaxID=443218 RepID=F6EEG5_HOYSD|nr:ferredoxin [Hoyosella subflava]AEF38617.1 Conserved domain protein [Hoyosella subflava DQS3-9A1]
MKITVDEGKCCAGGQCVLDAPDVFDQRADDGIVVRLDDSPGEDQRAAVQEVIPYRSDSLKRSQRPTRRIHQVNQPVSAQVNRELSDVFIEPIDFRSLHRSLDRDAHHTQQFVYWLAPFFICTRTVGSKRRVGSHFECGGVYSRAIHRMIGATADCCLRREPETDLNAPCLVEHLPPNEREVMTNSVVTETLSPQDIVRAVYSAFNSLDPDIIEETARTYFADTVVVREAESLPWGGIYEGIETVAAMTKGLASPASPVDAANLHIDHLHVGATSSDNTTHVLAAVSFPWRGAVTIPMKALEWFTVRDDKVVEIQVYLWDTAAAISALPAT